MKYNNKTEKKFYCENNKETAYTKFFMKATDFLGESFRTLHGLKIKINKNSLKVILLWWMK